MKWILIIILIFVVMLIASAFSKQYKERYDFYLNLKTFLEQFKINLSFKQDKIGNFLTTLKPKSQFLIFISAYKKYITENKIDLSEIKILDNEERLQIENIVKSIGKYDTENEIKQIDSFISDVDVRLKKSENDKNKLCPMIIKLSLLFAIGLAIILA